MCSWEVLNEFDYEKGLLSNCQGSPITIEKFAEGEFRKYSNNNNCTAEMKSAYVKAQTLVYSTFILSEGKYMLLNN